MAPANTDSSQDAMSSTLSRRLLMLPRRPSGPSDGQGSSMWMRELKGLLPSLTSEQRSYVLEFAFWSPTGVWEDFILPSSESDSRSEILRELEGRHLIERTHDPFIVDRPGRTMWRITGGGHDPDRLLHYHIRSLGEGEASSIFKKVFNRVIHHFLPSDSRDGHRPTSPDQATAYPVEAWESLPHAARLIKVVNEADFHEALLGYGEESVQMMLEVVWLTSCIETMDELLSQGIFPQSDRADVVSLSQHTKFRDQSAHACPGS